jgi:hypothetical protein
LTGSGPTSPSAWSAADAAPSTGRAVSDRSPVHNERVPAPVRRRALPSVAAATVAALALAGCSSSSDGDTEGGGTTTSAAASPSPSPSSTVKIPDEVELTDQGKELSFGDPATVIFEPTQDRGTVLQMTVQGAEKGDLKTDFKGFILDDPYKRNANYYYVKVQVKNVGEGDVGGVPVPLWGVNATNTLLPPLKFSTTFAKCPSPLLPAKFPSGATLDTCLAYLSPDHGSLEAASYRPSQEFNPITWTGEVVTPKPTPTKKPKAKKKG